MGASTEMPPILTFVCSTCGKSFTRDMFYTTIRGNREQQCKNCRRAESNKRYARSRAASLVSRKYPVITFIEDREQRIAMIKKSMEVVDQRIREKFLRELNRPEGKKKDAAPKEKGRQKKKPSSRKGDGEEDPIV